MKKAVAIILSVIFTCILILQPICPQFGCTQPYCTRLQRGGAVCAEAAVLEATRFQTVVCGEYHMAAIDTDGNLWMWGANASGQIGNGTTEDALTPQLIMRNVKSVALNGNTTAAIDRNNDLWIWGYMSDDLGARYDRENPTKVMSNIVCVSLGTSHGVAVDTSGNLWAWGFNKFGQLTDGTTESWSNWDGIGAKLVRTNVVSAYAGHYHTGYIDTNGDLWMCGCNEEGQIGIGERTESVVTPVRVLQNVVSASMNYSTTMALTESGDVYTWGGTFDCDMGRDRNKNPYMPGKAISGMKEVSTYWGNLLAVDTEGNLWACGDERYGELLDGEENGLLERFTKVKSGVVSASAGYYNTAYIDTDGQLWVVGPNYHGELGNGTCGEDSYSLVPIQVTGTASINEYGDVDGNGKIEASDALATLRHVVRLTTLNGAQQIAADVDNDNGITAADALLILKKVVKLIEGFPAEK